jgi:hypothetical protein
MQPLLATPPPYDLEITEVVANWEMNYQWSMQMYLEQDAMVAERDLYRSSTDGFKVTIKNTGSQTVYQLDFNASWQKWFDRTECAFLNESFHQRFNNLNLAPGQSVTLRTSPFTMSNLVLSDPLPGCYWPSAPNLGIDENPENDIYCTTHPAEIIPWQIVNSQETLLSYDARNRVINANVDIRDPQNAESIFQLTIVNTLGQPILQEPDFEVEFSANYQPNLRPGTYVAILTRDGEIVDRMQFLYF